MASLHSTPSCTLVLRRVSVPLVLVLAALPTVAQKRTWSKEFGSSPAGSGAYAVSSAPDAVGGAFVGGHTFGNFGGANSGPSGTGDAWLARYDGSGNRIWIRQFGSSTEDYASAVAPDGAGGVFVAGITYGSLGGPNAGNYDTWLARYDGSGNRIWIVQLGTSERDVVEGCLASDGAGGVHVGGYTSGDLGGPSSGGDDIWLAHYDGLGNLVWIRQYGTSEYEAANAAAPDGTGGVYVGGYTDGNLGGSSAGFGDAWLAHFDAAGDLGWLYQFGTGGGDSLDAATPDNAYGVLVAGYTNGDLGGPNQGDIDVWVGRYDSAGNATWLRQMGTSTEDRVHAAAPDGAGGMYIGGYTGIFLTDAWLARYDGAGNRTWLHKLQTTQSEYAMGAAPDGAGGVIASGYTEGSLGGTNFHGTDVWLARYDDTGSEAWMRQFGEGDRETVSISVPDDEGGLFAGGITDTSLGGTNAGMLDAWLARYDGGGNRIWILQLGTSAEDSLGASAPDGAGGLFVGGSTEGSLGAPSAGRSDVWLARYDELGGLQWILQLGTAGDESACAAAPDGAGGFFVGGATRESFGGPSAGGDDAWLARYDGAGNQVWILQLGTTEDDLLQAAVPDGAGGVYVGGTTRGSLGAASAGLSDAWLARYDGAGNQLWILQLGTTEDDAVLAAAMDGEGGAYVGGETHGSLGAANAGDADAWLARYDGAGNQVWIRQLGTSARDSASAAGTRDLGGVFVGGATYGVLGVRNSGDADAWLARFDGAGRQGWVLQYGTSARDSLGAIAPRAGGFSCGGSRGADAWLAVYADATALAVARNGSGVNRLCFTSTSLPLIGGTWTADIDASTHPGAVLTLIRAHTQPLPGVLSPYGEILVNLSMPLAFSSAAVPDGSGVAHHALAVPKDPLFILLTGYVFYAQGIIVGGSPELCNAIDLTAGF